MEIPRGTTEGLCQNPHIAEYVEDDHKIYKGRRELREVVNVLNGMREASQKAHLVQCSTLIIFGT